MRRALGAGNPTIVRQLRVQSLVLAAAGGIVGIFARVVETAARRAWIPRSR